jgi:uncharacterized protein Yka (UPF0111/DUF47 family)
MGIWSKDKKSFFEYFEEQALQAHEAAKLLEQLFTTVDKQLEISQHIHDKEHLGDQIAHTVINEMNSHGFILSIDHADILLFVKTLDDVIDYIDDSSESYTDIYDLKSSTPYAKDFAQLIIIATEILHQTCQLLKQASHNAKEILSNCIKIHEIENRADVLKKGALKTLFAGLKKGEVDFADYSAWHEIYCTLEIVTDKIEDCANVAEQIVTKYS